MEKSINDATLQKSGDIYQYLIALKDCFELKAGETLYIESYGDVSVVDEKGVGFQKEVKHHFGVSNLLERDIDFWKTLANWYTDYERVKNFSNFILSTTANITQNSSFYKWNQIDKNEKLQRLKNIGKIKKTKEKIFRIQYERIFNADYDENRILTILDRFTIESAKTNLEGISNEFTKYIGHIPVNNRDQFIEAILGYIICKVKDVSHVWSVTREEFDDILLVQSQIYGHSENISLPNEFGELQPTESEIEIAKQKKFVDAIRKIKYDKRIDEAISDYWKTMNTIEKYFYNNISYINNIEPYKNDMLSNLRYAKDNSELDAEDSTEKEKIKISRKLYNDVMMWEPRNFGHFTHNQQYFQRGIIHNIVDDGDFRWKVGETENEH